MAKFVARQYSFCEYLEALQKEQAAKIRELQDQNRYIASEYAWLGLLIDINAGHEGYFESVRALFGLKPKQQHLSG